MNGKKSLCNAFVLFQISFAIVFPVIIAPDAIAQDATGSAKGDSTRDQARYQFERGVSFYQSGQYERALEAFQQAYNLKPSPVVRINIANCYEQMDRPTEAIFNFERFLADGEANSDQRRAVETAVKRLRSKVGEVAIQVVPDGASVQIDTNQKRVAPIIEPVTLIAGTHFIEVTHPDYAPERREIQVVGGKPMEVSIILRRQTGATHTYDTPVVAPGPQARLAAPKEKPPEQPVTTPEAAPEPEPATAAVAPPTEPSETARAQEPIPEITRRESSSGRTTAVVIAGVVTAGLAVTTGILGGLALNSDSKYKDLADDWQNQALSATERDKAREDANTEAYHSKNLALATDIFLASSAVSAAVTLCLYFLWPKPRESSDSNVTTLAPSLSPYGAGMHLTGSF